VIGAEAAASRATPLIARARPKPSASARRRDGSLRPQPLSTPPHAIGETRARFGRHCRRDARE